MELKKKFIDTEDRLVVAIGEESGEWAKQVILSNATQNTERKKLENVCYLDLGDGCTHFKIHQAVH